MHWKTTNSSHTVDLPPGDVHETALPEGFVQVPSELLHITVYTKLNLESRGVARIHTGIIL